MNSPIRIANTDFNRTNVNIGFGGSVQLVDNKSENRVFKYIVNKLELNKTQSARLHREISKQGLTAAEIEVIAIDLFGL